MANDNTKEKMIKVKVKDNWNDTTNNLLLNPSQVKLFEWIRDNQFLAEDIFIEILNEDEVYKTI